ncbi:TetR family transcriptional regulator [Nocardiopsis sp. NPDC049922]|uniref:TetR/AcrR family transcriptional regulator n=1 Tax=Nocardiopsis sp. NPDC049922 TaxID=3155157 RepID=UPI0033F6E6EB
MGDTRAETGRRGDRPARRRDPRRRIAEITEATARVIEARGVEGLTHRAVAEEAEVPLGATTYHFATREDLIAAALRASVERYTRYLDDWVAQRPDLGADQFVVLLADAVVGAYSGAERAQGVMEFELHVAAMRRPDLRPLVDRFVDATVDALAHYTDPLTAEAVAALTSGVTLRGLASSAPPDRTRVEALLRRVLAPTAPEESP